MKNRIKELRIEKNMLQSDVAKLVGKSERMIGFYENGERDPNTETLAKLSEIFDCSIDYILGKSDIRNPEQQIKDEFSFAYHKETEGLSEEEVKEAIEFYKRIKYGKNEEKK